MVVPATPSLAAGITKESLARNETSAKAVIKDQDLRLEAGMKNFL